MLVANRGEIAARLRRDRGARHAWRAATGLRTVAVYSEVDRNALHVRLADEAVCIGPAPAAESYLNIDKIVDVAIIPGAQAIHSCYEFLSERADSAQAIKDAGLVFIGPDAASIEAMGDKSASKRLMVDAQVLCVPGFQGSEGAKISRMKPCWPRRRRSACR